MGYKQQLAGKLLLLETLLSNTNLNIKNRVLQTMVNIPDENLIW